MCLFLVPFHGGTKLNAQQKCINDHVEVPKEGLKSYCQQTFFC